MKRFFYGASTLIAVIFCFSACGIISAEIIGELSTSIDISLVQKDVSTRGMTEYAGSHLLLEEIFLENTALEDLIQQIEGLGIEFYIGREYDSALYEGMEGGGYYCSIETVDTDNISSLGISFIYDIDRNLSEISVSGYNAPATARGARIGDSESRVMSLYGNEYQKKIMYTSFLEYQENGIFLMFRFERDELIAWFLSNESLIELLED